MRSTFKVLFYVNGSKEKNGIVPIMGRVTINGSVAQFSCKQSVHKERGFLTEDELQAFTTIELNSPELELARDLFVFGCWTGISFIDIKNLTTENITMLGGSPWIVSKRQKTGVPFQIKLMDIPMQIIKRYEPYRVSSNLFYR